MREREKRKLVDKTIGASGDSFGPALYLRPYLTDNNKISEIVRATGEKRSVVAKKLINCGLNGKQPLFGDNKSEEKLDWLINRARHQAASEDAKTLRIDLIEEHSRATEEHLAEIAAEIRTARMLEREIFCMLNICVSSLNQIFTKLLEFHSPVEFERHNSAAVADRNIIGLIENAVADLENRDEHCNIASGGLSRETLYLFTKIAKLRDRIARSTEPNEGASGDLLGA